LFGSPIEKEIKKLAAQGEPAWKVAGKEPGLLVWRIEKFQVKEWPKQQYGKFYDGDSYIVLKTYKVNDTIKHDVHFWLGSFTSLDEAGTAAYKTVELDDALDGVPVQYREVQGSESDAFLALFPHFSILSGGVDSGFKHVEVKEYRKRLLHIKGTTKNIIIREVPAHTSSLNKGDVFILDLGLKVIQFVPPKAGVAEKGRATQLSRALDDERGSKVEIQVIGINDDDDHSKQFWEFLGGKAEIAETCGDDAAHSQHLKKRMFRIHENASGKIDFTEVTFAKTSLDSGDVFLVDVINQIFVWNGKGATGNERKEGFSRAQTYLNQQSDRKVIPVVRVMEGGENEEFHHYL